MQSKRLTLPATPDAYKHELPKDFKAPEGFGDFQFNAEDPALKNFATVAHESGLSQDQYSKALSSYAATQIAAQQAIKTAMAGEITKLGVNGPARIDALHNFIKGAFGEKAAETAMGKGGGFGGMLWTAAQVEFMEGLVGKLTSGGSSSFSQQGRTDHEPKRLSDDEYSKLTRAEKDAYARQFDQSKFTKAA